MRHDRSASHPWFAAMLNRTRNYLLDLRDRQRMIIALTKGQGGRQARVIDDAHPHSWEFSGFSQNGEDGVLDVLRGRLRSSNRYFLEIGSGDGVENNTCWLAVVEKYNGVMLDGNAALVERTRRLVGGYNIGIECREMFFTRETAGALRSMSLHADPDVFSLDIDGNDYHVMKEIFASGLRPKICIVEYNSAFGPDRPVTIPYDPAFRFKSAHPTQLYYGVSVRGWRALFEGAGYRFVSVDRHGVNAVFVDPVHFDTAFLDNVVPVPFCENRYQQNKFRMSHDHQFQLISDRPLHTISP